MLYMALFLVIDTTAANGTKGQSPSQRRAATGAIVMIYFSGFGWALGWNSKRLLAPPLYSHLMLIIRIGIQYLINSEIYPLRLRALGGSIAMTVHFVNQYGNSKAVPLMFLAMTTGGTMFFFSAVTAVGLAWVWFFLPETSGKSLEAMDALFNLPWYLIGRKGKEMTAGIGAMADVLDKDGEKKMGVEMEATRVERVGEVGEKNV
jgi:hypothetical protein